MSAATRKRKVFAVDARVIQALSLFARETGASLDDVADQAFRELLRKHKRPTSLKDALKESTRRVPANDREPASRAKPARGRK